MKLFSERSYQESSLQLDAMSTRQPSLAEKAKSPRAVVALSAQSSVNWIRERCARMRRLIDLQHLM